VARRLGLVELLPEAIQQQVNLARTSANCGARTAQV
jgi:hypothetical protein